MEFEDVANLSNSTEPETPWQPQRFIAHEIVFAIFAIFGITADLIIIYGIFHFKQLHTVANIFLANWAIADLACLLVTPSAYRIVAVLDDVPLPEEFFCVLFHSGYILHAETILFAILVTIDWIISAYFRQASDKFRKVYKYLIGALWVVSLILLSTSLGLCCTAHHYAERPIFMILPVVFVFAMFLLVLGIQITRLVQKLRKRSSDVSSLPINIVTTFSACWILALFSMIFGVRYIDHPIMEIVSCLLIFSSPLITLGLLYCFSKDFHACVLEMFRCSRVKYQEDLNERVLRDNVHDTNTMNMMFNKRDDKLVNN